MFANPRAAAPVIAGLQVAGKQEVLPLKDVSVKATVSGYLVGLDSILKYHNEGDNPVEVLFRFPLEESFAVVGLEAVIAGRRIKAEVKEKEEARQTYDDAIASGFSAALAEEKSGDIFSISLGNLPPKTEAELHLKLAGELPIDAEGGVRFTLPSVLKPRYTPQGSSDPLANIGDGGTGQVQQATAPAVFNFNLEVTGSNGVSNVTSPTHDIRTETREGRVHVSLSEGGPLNKDLVLLVHYSDPHQPRAITEPGRAKSGAESWMSNPAVMLNFFPKFSTARAACEFIFVVDRSGSMSGGFIKSASETLVLFLKSIPPGCHFNIIGFGSRYQSLFPRSVPYDQSNLDTAVRHAEGLRADLGGTELLSPLRHIFGLPLLSGLPRQVFVLTDGSVSNTSACISEVKKNVKHTRCFTIGIGSGASTALVKGLARAGNGTAEFIQGGERMQPKVISSLKRALQPSVTDLKAEFKLPAGYEILQAPAKLPTIFNGDKAVVYGIVCSTGKTALVESAVKGTATLRGMILGKTIEYSIPFQIPQPSEEETGPFAMPMVHHLAAKSLLKDWEAGEGVKQLKTPAKEAIIKLSIDSSVVSAHTAYVAVDEDQDKPIEGAIQTWDVTAMMAQQEGRSFGLGGGFAFGGNIRQRFNLCSSGPAAPRSSSQPRDLFGGPPTAQGYWSQNTTGGLSLGSSANALISRSHESSTGSQGFGFGQPQPSGQSSTPFGNLQPHSQQQPLAFGQPLFGSTSQPLSSGQLGSGFGQPQSSSLLGSDLGQPQSSGLLGSGLGQPQSSGLLGSGLGQPQSSGLLGSGLGQPQSSGLLGSGLGQPQSSGWLGLGLGQPQSSGSSLGQPQSSDLFGSGLGRPQSSGSGLGQPLSSGLFSSTSQPQSNPFGSTLQPLSSQSFGFGQPQSSGLLGSTSQPLSSGLLGSTSQPLSSGLLGSTSQPLSSGLLGSAPQPMSTDLLGSAPQPMSTGLLGSAPQLQSSGLFGQPSSGFGQPQSLGFGQTVASHGTPFGQQQPQLLPDTSFDLLCSAESDSLSSAAPQTSASTPFGQQQQQQQQSSFGAPIDPFAVQSLSKASEQGAAVGLSSDKLLALISLQQAEGSWKLDAALAGVLSKSLPELEGACPVGCQGNIRPVWATVLALAYLEACLSGQREEWELVAMKAEFWLEEQSLPAGTTLQTLREAARKCF